MPRRNADSVRNVEATRERTRALWAAGNVDVINFLRETPVEYASNTFIRDMRTRVTEGNYLTQNQTDAVRRIMSEHERNAARRPSDYVATEATATTGLVVPNGSFTVHSQDGQTNTFLFYTCQRGSLRGKRIVKIMDPLGIGGWRGFAFITESGHLRLWRRFEEDRDAGYVRQAEQLIAHFRLLPPSNRNGLFSVDTNRINATYGCLRCNTTVSPQRAQSSCLCSQHHVEEGASTFNTGGTIRFEPLDTPTSIRPSTPAPTLVMSEVNSEEIR